MIFRAGNRFDEENYFLTEIDTDGPDCQVTGFLDGVPVSFFGDAEEGEIFGGAIEWNQIFNPSWVTVNNGIRATIDDNGLITLTGTSTSTFANIFGSRTGFIENHKYFLLHSVSENPNDLPFRVNANNNTSGKVDSANGSIFMVNNPSQSVGFGLSGITAETDYTGVKLYVQLVDITQMFGSAIADSIYSLEQTSAGAGVTLFKTLFAPDDYYDYTIGENMRIILRRTE